MIYESINKIKGAIKISIKDMWAYKTDFFMWAVSFPLMLIAYYFAWGAIFRNTGQDVIRGFTFTQMISYYVLAMIVGIFASPSESDRILARKIKSGKLVGEMVRPLSIYLRFLSRTIAHSFFFIPIFVLPILVFAVLFFGLNLGSTVYVILFAVSLIIALFLNFAFLFLFGTAAFWLKEYRGVHLLRQGVFWVLTGALLPLTFFPQWFQKLSWYLPFQHMRYSVVQIALGNFTVLESIKVIVLQIGWTAVLTLIALLVMKRGLRRFSGVGM